jgi:RsiW-degrading membrane proteinase PrsW (M82 family)/predicted RNA-binding Zn-ribbon protein involved in translation (DUF1610 family)
MLIIITISAVIGLLYILYLRKYDLWEPEPIGKVIASGFIGGLIAILFATFAYWIVNKYLIQIHETTFHSFVFIGPIEELSKLAGFFFCYLIFIKKEINEPVDTIIYLSAIALGFSIFENTEYALKGGAELLIIRYLFASPVHILISIPMGIPLYVGLIKKRNRIKIVIFWLISSSLHGLWDALAFNTLYLGIFSTLMLFMFYYANSQLSKGLLASPFYPNIQDFFKNGKKVSRKNILCLKCNSELILEEIKNKIISYYICSNCGNIIIDRDNAFRIIHYYFATFSNLSNEYIKALNYPEYYTIRNCVFIRDKDKIGFLDIAVLTNQIDNIREIEINKFNEKQLSSSSISKKLKKIGKEYMQNVEKAKQKQKDRQWAKIEAKFNKIKNGI